MSIRAYYRFDLAVSQLGTALRLYNEGDYVSSITLAGASEEVFGKLLAAKGDMNAAKSIAQSVAKVHLHMYGESIKEVEISKRLNLAKNSIKHFDKGDPEIIKLDLQVEASDLLHRAIENFEKFNEKLSPAMEEFLSSTC